MKRFLVISQFILLFIVVEIFNWICLLLDEIFYPSYRKIKIKSPVFIIGMPRTGSTFLHNLLYNDRDNFTTMKLWETMFCPSVIQKRLARFFMSSKRFYYLKLSALLFKIDKYLFRNYHPWHPTGLFHVEEDDLLLLPVFASQTFVYLLPELKCFRNLVYFDARYGERWKRMIMSFYKRGIQKHLFVYGANKTYLAKCPFHTAKMDSLKKTFQGIRFICLTREPEKVIPSTINLLKRLSSIYNTFEDIGVIRERVLLVADHWYGYPLKIFSELPQEIYMVIDFKDLTGYPEAVIRCIYAHFRFDYNNESFSDLIKEISNSKGYRSGLDYSPGQYGLDPGSIRLRYDYVYQDLVKLSAYGNQQEKHVPFPMVKD
jgi:omega-hydroxy-beta-dihydromenaquinone-9 sulfotransferase